MLQILKSGLHSSVQDLGRHGFRDSGVPVSGAMDIFSALLANRLLGNRDGDAVLEATLVGPVVQFWENSLIAICGAHVSAKLNGLDVAMKTPVAVKKGDILSLEKIESGVRTYLAVKGGFITEEILGSRSFYKTVTGRLMLKKNDLIPFEPFEATCDKLATIRVKDTFLFDKNIEVFKGPEFDFLNPKEKEELLKNDFHLSEKHNRMAVFLKETLGQNKHQIITSPTLPGTVQLTPSGQLMLLMRDAQTTGGYPRILQLSEMGINTLAQKKTGDAVRFILL